MNTHLDTLLVALAIAGALGFLCRGLFRRKSKAGCAGGCGCDVAKKSAFKKA